MKILHVLNGSHYGGASVMAAEMAAAQRKLGIDAQVCLLEGGATADRIRLLNVPVHAYDPEAAFSSKRGRWNALYHGFREICRLFEPDILHSHLALPNLLCSRLRRQDGTKWIATLHGSWRQYLYSPETLGAPWRKPYLLLRYAWGVALTSRSAEMITTMTHDGAHDWRMAGIAKRRLRVIPNGIAPLSKQERSLRREWNVPDDATVIGSLGYFAPVKGFDLLTAAFEHISARHPKAYLVIAGGDVMNNSSLRNKLIKRTRTSVAPERLLILDEQSDSVRFLSALDCYVSASRSEGMSLALLEAMHLGLPCIVSSAGGNPEVVRDKMDGLVFESGNIADLA
ncbi:glycosyltransferase family 4 protein, partial [bacterium]|nr:glycosyltransferase family 4 protein [bacterium]